ncbi:MAG: rod shape-determining protein RodA [Deltaproteobacteria bacterium]|nr:rod shape-determining protein RodA [Deltaproteobacteria bacterium]
MFDRRLITHFNWPLLIVTVLLSAMGLFNLYSATSTFDVGSQTSYFKAQIVWSAIGAGSLLVVFSIHYRHYHAMSYVFYGATAFLLVLVLVMGRKVSGHQSWLTFGPVSLQPTEIAKLGLIFGLSRYLTTVRSAPGGASFRELAPPFLLFLFPTALVIFQGDLGSSLFFGLIFGTMVLVRGVRWQVVVSLLALFVITATAAYFFFLSPYQKNRIATFLNPEMDRRGAGYHLVQSKIAVGSGGFSGKGYLKGKTHKLHFIPERHTDFIFPVLAEEWGFLGSLVVLISYGLLLFFGLEVASRAHDVFSFFLSVGICALFFWHMVINLGGVLGLMPLTGVPLPFFSYGGSALMTNWIGIGILLNVSMRRFMF